MSLRRHAFLSESCVPFNIAPTSAQCLHVRTNLRVTALPIVKRLGESAAFFAAPTSGK